MCNWTNTAYFDACLQTRNFIPVAKKDLLQFRKNSQYSTQNTMLYKAFSSWFVFTTVAHFWCRNTRIMGGVLVGAAPTGSMTIDVTVHDDDPLHSRGRNSSPRTTQPPASVQVGIENEELFGMLNFTLNVRSGSTARASKSSVTNQVMNVKTESTKRTTANGLEEVIWRGITET
jgi:hypothetical protein